MSWQFPTVEDEIRYLQGLQAENERPGEKYAQRVAALESNIRKLRNADGNGGPE